MELPFNPLLSLKQASSASGTASGSVGAENSYYTASSASTFDFTFGTAHRPSATAITRERSLDVATYGECEIDKITELPLLVCG